MRAGKVRLLRRSVLFIRLLEPTNQSLTYRRVNAFTTTGALLGTTGVLAGTGLPLGASTACGCEQLIGTVMGNAPADLKVGEEVTVTAELKGGKDKVKFLTEKASANLELKKGCENQERGPGEKCESKVKAIAVGKADWTVTYVFPAEKSGSNELEETTNVEE